MVGGASIPGNWASFLRVDDNMTELFSFLSGALHDSFQLAEKQLVITDGDTVLSKPPLPDITGLAPCNHEEADIRMMLHAAHAGHNKIIIRTVDTDVVVLAVALTRTLAEDDEVWVFFSMGKAFRFLTARELARALGPEKAQALPMFHALTGCDMSPASPDTARGQHRQCGQLNLRSHRPSLTSPLHQFTWMKMLCRPLRGSSSCSTTGRALQPMWTRHAANWLQIGCKLPRRVMYNSYHRQVQPSSSTSDELCTRAVMFGASFHSKALSSNISILFFLQTKILNMC